MKKASDITPEFVEKTIELGQMMLNFGRVNRVTYHEDGKLLESDTTHTVMLGVMACAYAKEFAPHLDLGKIAQFALVHDLVEVYAGDTNSFGNMGDTKDKDAREAESLTRIKKEFDGTFPWIGEIIHEYEGLSAPEARYVKVFDKVLPKITHVLNRGATIKELGHSKESTNEFVHHQYKKIAESYGADQHEALALLAAFHEAMESIELS